MKTLKLVNFNLKNIELNYCGLKSLELNTPHLETFRFLGPRMRPCRIELGICKKLKMMHLTGVAMNNMMFMDCNKTFPVLQCLILRNCDMTGCINISSNSLRDLFLEKFNKSIEITVTAPNLFHIIYSGSEICSFSNMNVGRLFLAKIELYRRPYQKCDDIWFLNLNEMLRCLKAKTVGFETNFEKNIIIPKQLRQNLMPPLDGTDVVSVEITSRTRDTIDLVELADSMLWIAPRLECLTVLLQDLLLSRLTLVHGDYSRKQKDSCSFCTSDSIRCWRHSVTHFQLTGFNEDYLKCYLKENLQKVERVAIDGPI